MVVVLLPFAVLSAHFVYGIIDPAVWCEFELPTLPKAALQRPFFFLFFFLNRGLDSQRIMEAHSPSLHVYTTVEMLAWGKERGKKKEKALQGSKYLLITTFIAGMVKWRLAPVCLFHLVWFSNLLEAQDTVREHNDQKGLKELKLIFLFQIEAITHCMLCIWTGKH